MTTNQANPTDRAIICQWEIGSVCWDHEDGTSKIRRALVISTSAFNYSSDEIWFAKISTKKRDEEHRLEFDKNAPAFVGTGLTETSYFYLANTRKVHRNKIIERKGRLQAFSVLMTSIALKQATKNFP